MSDRYDGSDDGSARKIRETALAPPGELISAYLDGLDASQLRSLVRELAEADQAARQVLDLRAASEAGEPEDIGREFRATAHDVFADFDFLENGNPYGMLAEANRFLDEMERHLDSGTPDTVAPALLAAIDEMRRLTKQDENSGEVLEDICERTVSLYAWACQEGNPDRDQLARWLVNVQSTRPGWPELTIGHFAEALGDEGMVTYRAKVRAVEEEHRRSQGLGDDEVDRMVLELADHDRDLVAAIRVLAQGRSPRYAEIISRLRKANRGEEVLDWIDRAVAKGRVTHAVADRNNPYWLVAIDVAQAYDKAKRTDDAINVLRGSILSSPGPASLKTLLDFAQEHGVAEAERRWAITQLRSQAASSGSGSALVRVALSDGDVEAAWQAAEEFGVGDAWQELANASRFSHPRAAADLYEVQVREDLRHANTRVYPEVANKLGVMRGFYSSAGQDAEFQELIGDIRRTHKRRSSLMKALDQARL